MNKQKNARITVGNNKVVSGLIKYYRKYGKFGKFDEDDALHIALARCGTSYEHVVEYIKNTVTIEKKKTLKEGK